MRKCWTHNSRADQAAAPVGGGAWPGFEVRHNRASTAGVKDAGGAEGTQARLRCPWAAAGPGRASSRRTERSSRRGRRAGGPPPTAQPGPDTLKPRPAHAGRGLPTQSGGRV